MTVAAPVVRWPGSKWRIADWVIGHLPPHKVYVEPFFGSGGVFFKKDPSTVEIINDLDGNIVCLMRVLREQPDTLAHQLSLTPWAADEYWSAWQALQAPEQLSDLERARCVVVVTWQQYGKRAISYRSGWRFRGIDQQSPLTSWRSLPERIQFAAARIMNAQVSHMDGLKLIERVNRSEALLYVDPPYLEETRKAVQLYDCELRTREQHERLLEVLKQHVGPVVLSGYPSAFYRDLLPGWHSVSTTARAQSNGHREECLWLNPVAWRRLQGTQDALQFDFASEGGDDE